MPALHSSRKALIAYGSETGTAQDLAEEVGRITERLRFETRVCELDAIRPPDLLRYDAVIVTISTTGQGDLPANSRSFWRRLLSKRLLPGCLSGPKFATFGLGDSSYPQFNWAHRKLHARIAQLGAQKMCDRGESDEQHPEGVDALFLPWTVKLKSSLLECFPLSPGVEVIPDDEFLQPKWKLSKYGDATSEHSTVSLRPKHHRALNATVTGNKRLTPQEHWQDVRLFTFDLPSVNYGPGDVLTIYPRNFAEDVDALLILLGWKHLADERIALIATTKDPLGEDYPPPPISLAGTDVISLRDLFLNHLDFNAIPRRSFFGTLAHFTEDEVQKERLLEFTDPELIDELYDYTTRPRRSIFEVLQEFDTVKIPFQWAMSVFPTARGRQFSIASGGSLKYLPDNRSQIELLVAIVKYKTVIKKVRQGLCTRYMASLERGVQLQVTVENAGMKFEPHRPAIMVGPGTGVAPLRSMIYERRLQSKTDSSIDFKDQILFYGGRNKQADYFFENEWSELSKAKGLEVIPAFSRDQRNKVYVQDRIRECSSDVWKLLERGGVIHICGSSGKMPQAVREALIDVIQKESSTSREEAEQRLVTMEKQGLYQQETW